MKEGKDRQVWSGSSTDIHRPGCQAEGLGIGEVGEGLESGESAGAVWGVGGTGNGKKFSLFIPQCAFAAS